MLTTLGLLILWVAAGILGHQICKRSQGDGKAVVPAWLSILTGGLGLLTEVVIHVRPHLKS